MSTVPESDRVYGFSKEFWAYILTAGLVAAIPMMLGGSLMHLLGALTSAFAVLLMGFYVDLLYNARIANSPSDNVVQERV